MIKKKINILLIEDNPGDARLMAELLKEVKVFDCQFTHKTTLQEGLEQIQKENPDIILLDLNLPDSFGEQTFNRIQADYPDIPIILVSGSQDEELSLRLITLGAQDYIKKSDITNYIIERSISYSLERNRLLIKLKDSEASFRNLAVNMKDGILIAPADGKHIYANQYACEILGYTAEEILHTTLKDLADPEEYPMLQQRLLDRIAGLPVPSTYETKIRRKDGSVFPADIKGSKTKWHGQDCDLVLFRDITKRKHAEKALNEHAIRLQSLLELHVLNDAPFDEILDFVLDASQKMTGSEFSFIGMVDPDETELSVVRWSKGVMEQCKMDQGPLTFLVSETGLLVECIRTREPVFVNNYHASDHPRKNGIPLGHVAIKRMMAVPVVDSGRVTSIIALSNKPEEYTSDDSSGIASLLNKMNEMKRQKELEETLCQNEEKFRTVADFTYDWEAWSAPDGKFKWVSPSCKRVTGHSADEFITDHNLMIAITHPEDQHKVISHNQMAVDEEQHNDLNYDFRIVLPGGEIRWISHSCTPVYDKDGKWIGRRESNRDITDRKKDEESLREANVTLGSQYALLKALINSPGDIIIFSLDTHYRYTAFNENHRVEMKKVWNADIEVGMNILDCMHNAEFWAIAKNSIDRVLNGEVLSEIQHQSDLDIFYEFSWNPIVYEEKIVGVTVFIKDITERRRTEIEIKIKNEQLQKLNAEKDKFFSIIAHDLKSPFNSIIGFSDLLVEQMKERDCDGVEKYAMIIQESSNRAMDLLMNLMEWAKSQSGRMEFSPVHFDLAQLINNVVQILNDTAKQKSINITRSLTPDSKVFADKDMISTVLRNLLANAIKFTYPGGEINISVEKSNSFLVVSVSDTGVGISEDRLKKIFQIDGNFSTPGTQKEKGTGLGLVLCREFIEKNNGKIWVKSKLEKGSVFYFTLPCNVLQKEESAAEMLVLNIAEEKITYSTDRPLKILIAEDDETSAMLLSKMLKSIAREILVAENGEAALNILYEKPDIDLVLMDLKMPQKDGYEATRQIRLKNKELVIIAQSAFEVAGIRKKAVEAGCNAFLSKPIQKEKLLGLINSLFKNYS